jgi:hypothetical protein
VGSEGGVKMEVDGERERQGRARGLGEKKIRERVVRVVKI